MFGGTADRTDRTEGVAAVPGRARMTPHDYEYLCRLLKTRSGLVLSSEKHYLVESRLLPVARRAGLFNLSGLVAKLRGSDCEPLIVEVVEAMTTNESFFFRDKIPFDHFRETIMPALLTARAASRRIRIWCAAAATGQEPYSLAIALKEMGRICVVGGSRSLRPIFPPRCWKRPRAASTASSRCSVVCRR
jgi:hypothetical protein